MKPRKIIIMSLFFVFLSANPAFCNTGEEADKWLKNGEDALQDKNYKEALGCLEKALKAYKISGPEKQVALVQNDIAYVYLRLEKYEAALSYYKESLKTTEGLKDFRNIILIKNNIAQVYYSSGQYDKALNYYNESLDICKESDFPKEKLLTLHGIVITYIALGKYEEAISYRLAAVILAEKTNASPELVDSLNALGLEIDYNLNNKHGFLNAK